MVIPVLAAGLVTAVVVMVVTAVLGQRAGRVSVVDTAWGLGLSAIAVVAALLGDLLDVGDPLRRWVLAGLVAVWGLRLSWHMHRRNAGAGEDPRYAAMLGPDPDWGTRIRKVYGIQGAALWLVALPVMVAAIGDRGWSWLGWLGAAVWLLGVTFEAVGDAQLAAYKRDPDRGPVMDRGLWAWTRHPNYFGDACVWWGIWLVSLEATWWVLPTIVSPIAMNYFLVHATGARLLERTMMKRPGYREYAARTPMFLPRPPRR